MKKVLLATTALVFTAGVAAADGHTSITFSGEARGGIATGENTTDDPLRNALPGEQIENNVYSSVDLDVTFSGSTDGGTEYGATADFSAGFAYDTGDFEFDGSESGTAGLGSVFISYNGMTLTFDEEGIDDLYDDDLDSHDVSLEYVIDDFTATLTWDSNEAGDTDAPPGGGVDAEYSFSLAYDDGMYSASLVGNDLEDCIVAAVGYAADSFSVGLESDQSCDDDTVNTLSVSYTVDSLTIDAEVDDADGWSLGVSYDAAPITFAASTDDADEWEVTGTYEIGSGALIEAGINYDEDYYLGVHFSF